MTSVTSFWAFRANRILATQSFKFGVIQALKVAAWSLLTVNFHNILLSGIFACASITQDRAMLFGPLFRVAEEHFPIRDKGA
jgi:hypothetical protein